ncbi:MAG: hypothetical protein B6244_01870 [Candidatus Cloacimonetes bacterium 4572_55]|nr:MAG: hypothetical protein B6244_01870 [Candidatus Cloacimonetes bacterium 4572_55]
MNKGKAKVEKKDLPVIIELEKVSKTFVSPTGKVHQAIKDVSFKIHDLPKIGEFIIFLGPSGSGKSTVLNIIAGLIQPTEGEALFFGKPITEPGPDRGMVFQSYSSYPWLNVLENVAFGLKLRGVKKSEREDAARHYIKRVGLEGKEHFYPKNLSGGMRQRVAIARTLACKPRVILMDEPFGALDIGTRTEMQDLINEIWESIEGTILFVTHDIPEAIYLADRIYILSASPGTIKEIIQVDLPVHRSREIMRSPEFSDMEEHILDSLHKLASGGEVRL